MNLEDISMQLYDNYMQQLNNDQAFKMVCFYFQFKKLNFRKTKLNQFLFFLNRV